MKSRVRWIRPGHAKLICGIVLLCWGCFLKASLGSAAEACDGSGAVFHSVVNAENPSPEVKGGFSVMVNMCAIGEAVKDLLTRAPALDKVTLSRYTQDSGFSIADVPRGGRNFSYAGGFILKAGGILFQYRVEGDFSNFTATLQEIETADGKYVIHRSTGQAVEVPQKKSEANNAIDTVTLTNSKGKFYVWCNISEGGELAKGEVWIFGNIRGKLVRGVSPPPTVHDDL